MSAPKTILVVEDDEAIRMGLKHLLQFEGYRVETAWNGQDAMAQLKSKIPSLILLDLIMPVMDGWEVLSALAADEKLAKIPVIVTSAVPDVEKLKQATDFVRKPIEIEPLLASIGRHCLPAQP